MNLSHQIVSKYHRKLGNEVKNVKKSKKIVKELSDEELMDITGGGAFTLPGSDAPMRFLILYAVGLRQ